MNNKINQEINIDDVVEKIYNDVFLYIQHSNIDLFLCGGASNKSYISNRDELRKRLEKRIQN